MERFGGEISIPIMKQTLKGIRQKSKHAQRPFDHQNKALHDIESIQFLLVGSNDVSLQDHSLQQTNWRNMSVTSKKKKKKKKKKRKKKRKKKSLFF